jgi:hypothetical protein
MATFDVDKVPVLFNMDLANAPTSERFCREAAACLNAEFDEDGWSEEFASEIVDEWSDKLASAGYCALWNAGDVVVFDLRALNEDEREAFYKATENW